MTTPARGKTVGGNKDALARFALTRPIGALTALPASGDPVRGTFSPVIPWPLVGIHAVLTADGRVLSYGTKTSGLQTAYFVYDVWDPQLGLGLDAHNVLPNNTAVDIFCNAQILLPSGDIEMYGGDILLPQGFSANKPNDDSAIFRASDDSLVRTQKMNRKRWYASATMLPNGEVLVQGGAGGQDLAEVRANDGSYRLLTSADTSYLAAYYPRNFVAPDGWVFGNDYTQMFKINPSGTGVIARAGKFPANAGASSSAVMFRPGKILQMGGGPDKNTASKLAHIIDINPATPTVSPVQSMTYRRHWPNATVLADGLVWVEGGSTANNNPVNGVAYTSEIFDPATNSWSLGATAQQMRLYHSAALLMPDATVLTLGGGALGGENPGPQLNLNAEIYYPPYLFNSDGTPASRPIISTAPMSVSPATKFRIGTSDPSDINRVTLLKTGSVTHSFNMDQRFLQLPFTVDGGELEVTLPANAYETPPGFYMVFIINDDGVPSEATMMRINVAGQTPPATATLTVNKVVVNDNGGTGTAANFSFSVNNSATPVAFEADGSNVLTLPAGTYSITEPAASGYATTYSGCSNVVLAAGGNATCTITNNDIATSATLTVRKIVVNDSGGTKAASDFSFSVNGGAETAFEADGSNVLTIAAGAYNVTEPVASGYAASYSGCSGTLAAGGTATCTITNDDIATSATLTVRKIVVNDSGGTKAASDFGFSVNGGAATAFEADGSNVLIVAPGAYNVTEPAASGYAASYSGCSGTLAAGGSATCTITNDDIASGSANMIVNGDFEVNSLAPGTAVVLPSVLGWNNTAGQVKLWKGRNGYVSGSGQTHMEVDVLITVPNSIYQDVATVAGATYDLSFLQSPRPGYGANSNRFEVWWNGTLLGAFARNGTGLTQTNWQQANFVVTGTGNDRLWFKEIDTDVGGAFVDDVRLTAR
ncbi:MAG TPA: galactose oxidase-like domain-containing protein [Lysobacter sp.]